MVIIMIYVKTYEPTPFNMREILRYAGVKGDSADFQSIIDECISDVRDKLTYKVCYTEFPISVTDEYIDLGFIKTESKDLRKNLKNSCGIVLFGATIGIAIDRLIAKYSVISPVKALMFQAIGAERIESLCDSFNDEIKEKYITAPRFSAGYGDLPIEVQKDIFLALDCQRKIGVTLNGSMLMSPSKSVTAIIGVRT